MASSLDDTNRFRSTGGRASSPSLAPGNAGACLVVIHGADLGRRIELPSEGSLLAGRSARSDIVVAEECVTRHHARFEFNPQNTSWSVVDLGSTNGTYVNDEQRTAAVLRHGDQIQIGRTVFKFLTGGHVESAYHEEIYRLMTTDSLTGLLNRRATDEALARELGRAQRHERPLVLLILDLDHFKSINDTFGHLAGDAVLRQTGVLLRNNLRRSDLMGRLGGEEFAMILPEIDRTGGFIAAEKVRRTIEQQTFEFDRTRIPVTASLGVAERAGDDEPAETLIRRADEALYTAKRDGRNCVRG